MGSGRRRLSPRFLSYVLGMFCGGGHGGARSGAERCGRFVVVGLVTRFGVLGLIDCLGGMRARLLGIFVNVK